MILIACVCLFWAAMAVISEPMNLDDWLSLLIPAALTILLACDHVRLNAVRKRVEALEQKLAEKETQN